LLHTYLLSLFLLLRPPPTSTLFPYTTLFRSRDPLPPPGQLGAVPAAPRHGRGRARPGGLHLQQGGGLQPRLRPQGARRRPLDLRSEEHTSELQSRENLVCRLLLEKKNEYIHM